MNKTSFDEVLHEFLNCACPTYLIQDTDNVILIEFDVNGFYVRFNSMWIPEDQMEWFANVL